MQKIKIHKKSDFDMRDYKNLSKVDLKYEKKLLKYCSKSLGSNLDKVKNFTKYTPRQNLSQFLAKSEIFNKILNVHGHIIECGVFLGSGIMTWGNLSAIYEPYNHSRRVVGFDTFAGFTKICMKDFGKSLKYKKVGGLAAPAINDIKECINIYNLNRPIGHIPRIELVVGDALKKIPLYAEKNKGLVVALLYLDFDLYEPTKIAIETFLPRMPKGSIIAFDELNQETWPGETLAVQETIGLKNLNIKRFSYMPNISFAILD